MQLLKEKLDKSRSEAVSDFEQMMAELNRRNEREKQVLLEDNKKLSSNIDFVSLFCLISKFVIFFVLFFIEFLIYLTTPFLLEN